MTKSQWHLEVPTVSFRRTKPEGFVETVLVVEVLVVVVIVVVIVVVDGIGTGTGLARSGGRDISKPSKQAELSSPTPAIRNL